jgi:tungstate transport system ATP-binding protein
VPEPLYRLRNVAHSYGGRIVLAVDALEIHRGEIVALVGPSGAGKSTLLRLLNFLEVPRRGTIEYRGQPFDSTNPMPLPLRREVTTVFQRPLLLSRSVRDNVAYGLQIRGRNGRERVAAALEEVGLAPAARQPARTLSGGEAQRVALARATVLQPTVLLLDEPTANLDPYNVGLIEEIILRLNEEKHTTLVLVTHNVFQARRLAQRVVFLLNGSIIEVAGKDQFFEAPRDQRTAAFVRGEMVY